MLLCVLGLFLHSNSDNGSSHKFYNRKKKVSSKIFDVCFIQKKVVLFEKKGYKLQYYSICWLCRNK